MNSNLSALLTSARKDFHVRLLKDQVLSLSQANAKVRSFGEDVIASNADSGQKTSVQVSNLLINKIESGCGVRASIIEKKKDGQTLGNLFEESCSNFIRETFSRLQHLRPGSWTVEKVASRSNSVLGQYDQYSHLTQLAILSEAHTELKSFLGDGYTVAPDVIVARNPESDQIINMNEYVVDSNSCRHSVLREANQIDQGKQLLHASISCKFTMRSDRAQNTRTEALNLIRMRKGRAPHIVSVTAEPMPGRISSLALGTGDLDCVYHFALYELIASLRELEKDDSLDLLQSMIDGKRLKDISDLPLDLAI